MSLVHAVVFLCLDEAGQALLAHRRARDSHSGDGYWYGGSGTIEGDEDPEVACSREVTEEFGAAPTQVRYLGTREGFLDSAQGRQPFLVHDFVCRVAHREVRNAEPKEHDRIGWFDVARPDTWPRPWHPFFAAYLAAGHGTILSDLNHQPLRPAPLFR